MAYWKIKTCPKCNNRDWTHKLNGSCKKCGFKYYEPKKGKVAA